ncbi:hypothetical protein PENVUL_c009G08972 [Penicillium vulpinum]|uniref:Invertebrate defensins family profile domain-containing protein n=1 Tax=Penicillium vulpinum TaxID=29845 RepID=A0A1V6S3X3_9EURO|nr:hypothetical protein PENVUL_c009G08972 [Penicillium vulpinum]
MKAFYLIIAILPFFTISLAAPNPLTDVADSAEVCCARVNNGYCGKKKASGSSWCCGKGCEY